tara:strand:- start:123 stop:464 length:342 start_codon:yes stop_codon:yes gene_type:complete
MAIYVTNLTIHTGTDFDQVFVLADDASESILNLTGYTSSAKMKRHGTSATSTSFTTSFTNIAGGKVKIALTAAQTAELKPGRYLYDLILTNSSGENIRVVEGEIMVKKSVTRS